MNSEVSSHQVPLEVTFECRDSETWFSIVHTPEEIWELKLLDDMFCNIKFSGVELSEVERTAVAMVDGEDELESLKKLYGICVKADARGGGSPEQLKTTQAAAVLCPNHPNVDELKSGNAKALADTARRDAQDQLRDEGKLIGKGKYMVGSEIQPGTWVTTADRVEDCYWEIADNQGNIIDNNFVSLGGQLSVYLPEGTGFITERCGMWEWQGY